MAKFNIGDKVRITAPPDDWPLCTTFALTGARGSVARWVDWPEAMDPYDAFVYLLIDRVDGDAKQYEGAKLIIHEDQLEKLGPQADH